MCTFFLVLFWSFVADALTRGVVPVLKVKKPPSRDSSGKHTHVYTYIEETHGRTLLSQHVGRGGCEGVRVALLQQVHCRRDSGTVCLWCFFIYFFLPSLFLVARVRTSCFWFVLVLCLAVHTLCFVCFVGSFILSASAFRFGFPTWGGGACVHLAHGG